MMVKPTKRQLEIYRMFDKEVAPWCYSDAKTGEIKLKENAPQEIREKYELYMRTL